MTTTTLTDASASVAEVLRSAGPRPPRPSALSTSLCSFFFH